MELSNLEEPSNLEKLAHLEELAQLEELAHLEKLAHLEELPDLEVLAVSRRLCNHPSPLGPSGHRRCRPQPTSIHPR